MGISKYNSEATMTRQSMKPSPISKKRKKR